MDEIKKDGTGDAITILAMGVLILLSLPIVLPPLLLFGGLIAALMTGNRNFIKTTTALTQTLCVVSAVFSIGLFFFLTATISSDTDYQYIIPFGAAIVAIVAAILLKFRWADPLNRHFDKMYEAVNRKKPKPNEDKSPPIIARDALTTYSVADELIKWKSLKEEGVIDEAEFARIRDKLMQKDS